jgi:predicted transcriptional regulator
MSETGKSGSRDTCVALTAEIVAAYVSHNSVTRNDIPGLIREVHTALLRVAGVPTVSGPEAPKPPIAAKRSVTPEYIVCLEDGKKFKSLKRHLMTHYDLTPDQYREKWNLDPSYPMVAPNYAAARSQLAKKMGLGRQRKAR